jgi:hypothetical protein
VHSHTISRQTDPVLKVPVTNRAGAADPRREADWKLHIYITLTKAGFSPREHIVITKFMIVFSPPFACKSWHVKWFSRHCRSSATSTCPSIKWQCNVQQQRA